MKPKSKLKVLELENQKLRSIVVDLHWMARRYATGRSSAAPGMLNDIVKELLGFGIVLKSGSFDGTIWAEDGGGRDFDNLTDEQITPNTAEAIGLYIPLPRGARIDKAIVDELGTSNPLEALKIIRELKNAAKSL